MNRKKPLARGSRPLRCTGLPKRGGKPKAVNRKRKAANHKRAYGAKRAWIVENPCIVALPETCGGKIDAHHIKTGGMGYKSGSAFLIPLCATHHRILHAIGRRSFEGMYALDCERAAQHYEDSWQIWQAAAPAE